MKTDCRKTRTALLVQTLAVARRILREALRTRRTLVFWAAFPTLMLLLFGLIYAGRGDTRAFDRVAPGILVGAALFFSCLGGTVALVVAERERGTLRRLLVSPLSPVAWFGGIVLAFLAVAFAQAAILYALAVPFGGRFHGSPALGALVIVLCVVGYVGIGFVVGARTARDPESANGPVAAFGVPLLVLGGTFFPPEVLPRSLRAAAWLDPVFHMNEALRGVSSRGLGALDVAPHLFALVLVAALAVLSASRAFRALAAQEARS